MKEYMTDLQTRIEIEGGSRIYVDTYDNGVWLNIIHDAGSTKAVLTADQAKDMIAALIRIVDAEVSQ